MTPPAKTWPTYGKLICRWIEAFLVHGEGDSYGEPFRLRKDQKQVIYRWYQYVADSEGNFVRWRYDEMFLECATGYGKTELVAALALAELCGPLATPSANVPVAAAAYEQADELLGRARQIVEHKNCKLRPFVTPLDTEIQRKDSSTGVIKRIAAVAGTNEGGVPSLFIADELHEWLGNKSRLYIVVRKSLRKRKTGRIISLSTPGSDIKTLAGQMHEEGLANRDPRYLHVWITCDDELVPLINKEDPNDVDLAVLERAVRQANPWKDDEAVADLLRDFFKMPRHEFLRYHLARWVKVPKDHWLKDVPGAWEACAGEAKFEAGVKTSLGWDMSLNRDTTAVAAAQRRTDGKIVVRAKIFRPQDFPNHKIDNATVKQAVRDFFAELDADGCAYDPRLLETLSQELEDDGYNMIEFPQSPERMVPACQDIFDWVVNQELEHPNDPVLNEHVYNAVKRPAERGWQLAKRLSAGPIDGLIATILAAAEATVVEEASSELITF